MLMYITFIYRFVSKGCKLVGCGSAVPNLKVSNDDLSKLVETNDEWISTRTGIRNRRIISGKELHFIINYKHLWVNNSKSLGNHLKNDCKLLIAVT